MVFSSIVFLLFFLPVFLITYYFADRKYKNFVLLAFSIFFYSWGAPKFIAVILGTTFIDFHLVQWMDKTKSKAGRRAMLTISVLINFGLLFYFKYSDFFVENLNKVFSVFGVSSIHWLKIILPIGISFYTFETITYVVDVYRRVHKPLKNFWDYQLYIILFPKLIAGPIVRFHEIADQLTDRSASENLDNRLTGFYRFAIGLSKKVLIANVMGQEADLIFGMNTAEISTTTAWVGALAYTFQIYFDFSGYSDMAIGLCKMVGFKLPENFNNPYTSQSITEFWRRWHITLGNWMRNYLYIPLGGNRVDSKSRMYFNLWIVFLASGLWHGASWNFVIWGAYNGTFLVLEKVFLLKMYEKLGKAFRVVLTFIIVVFGWVFFRTENLHQAGRFIKKMLSFNFSNAPALSNQFVFILLTAIFFAFLTCFKFGEKAQNSFYYTAYNNKKHLITAFTCLLLFTICVGAITSFGFNPFIYFRF